MTLGRNVAGVSFPNPVLLASGTAGYGRELAGTVALDQLGGLVTKAVTLNPRPGNPPPRVSELAGAMLNSIGLANPGATHVRDVDLPWLQAHLPAIPVIVNIVGFTTAEYSEVIAILDDAGGHAAYELNLSCPNTDAGGVEFGANVESITAVVSKCREATRRPLFAKLSPALPAIPVMAAAAVDAGADGVTLVNTLPGTASVAAQRRLGQGYGGVSGPPLHPIALLAIERTARAMPGVPIIGVGGIRSAQDARDFLDAGASLVAIGTAALALPRLPERIARELERQWQN